MPGYTLRRTSAAPSRKMKLLLGSVGSLFSWYYIYPPRHEKVTIGTAPILTNVPILTVDEHAGQVADVLKDFFFFLWLRLVMCMEMKVIDCQSGKCLDGSVPYSLF
jgi:hypothetical protein